MTPEERKAYNRAHYLANKEKRAQYGEAYNAANRLAKREYNKRYYEEHKTREVRQEIPAFLRPDSDERSTTNKLYYIDNKEAIMAKRKATAAKKKRAQLSR